MQVTSIQELILANQGELINLPPFSKGTQFVVKLKRPSMLMLAAEGKIPNALLSRANGLFAEGAAGAMEDLDNEEMLKELKAILEIFANACLVEPTYQELKENGIQLTDDQYFAILNYAQSGVETIKPIDRAEENLGHNSTV